MAKRTFKEVKSKLEGMKLNILGEIYTIEFEGDKKDKEFKAENFDFSDLIYNEIGVKVAKNQTNRIIISKVGINSSIDFDKMMSGAIIGIFRYESCASQTTFGPFNYALGYSMSPQNSISTDWMTGMMPKIVKVLNEINDKF